MICQVARNSSEGSRGAVARQPGRRRGGVNGRFHVLGAPSGNTRQDLTRCRVEDVERPVVTVNPLTTDEQLVGDPGAVDRSSDALLIDCAHSTRAADQSTLTGRRGARRCTAGGVRSPGPG